MTDFVALLQNVGFPIFIVLWFMTRYEKQMEKVLNQLTLNNQAFDRLADTIEKLIERMNEKR